MPLLPKSNIWGKILSYLAKTYRGFLQKNFEEKFGALNIRRQNIFVSFKFQQHIFLDIFFIRNFLKYLITLNKPINNSIFVNMLSFQICSHKICSLEEILCYLFLHYIILPLFYFFDLSVLGNKLIFYQVYS